MPMKVMPILIVSAEFSDFVISVIVVFLFLFCCCSRALMACYTDFLRSHLLVLPHHGPFHMSVCLLSFS